MSLFLIISLNIIHPLLIFHYKLLASLTVG